MKGRIAFLPHSMHILVAEDDLFLQKIYINQLKKGGYDVSGVPDGERALQIMKTGGVDLVLLDIIMPKKNGFEVLQERKKSKALMNIPVIVLSSLGLDSDITKAKELGATDYFVKTTMDMEELRRAMSDLDGLQKMIKKIATKKK